jgi:hypothetical protein
MSGWRLSGGLIALLLCLAGCRPVSQRPEVAPGLRPPALPGSVLFSVDDPASRVRLRVYRDGPLAALGHSHVITPRGLSGSIQLHDNPLLSRVALQFPVADLAVDDPALRAAAGAEFSSEISAAGRGGTQQPMLGELVLDAARFPLVAMRSESIAALPDGATLQLAMRITVHGRDAVVEVPVRWERRDDVLSAHGEFSVLQSQFGMTPYSAMLGAMRVGDRIDIDFDLVARRVRL